ncbi:MAG: ABC transporter permease [Solidesulfovibrio sp. DCME]|uniref:ABC transporter permease n=1 Tax=Solidesulfovibrio sp. DCME TaxID=3447380 RepID=UPI003D0FA0DD
MSEQVCAARLSEAERVALVQCQKKRDKYTATTLSVAGILGFLIIWQVIASSGLMSERFLASPIEIVQLFFVKLVNPSPDGATLGVNILSSLTVALTGFVLAIAIGVPMGLLMGWYRGFDRFMRPIFEIVRPIPPVSWIPLTIVWLGIDLRAKAFIVFFAAFVPCLINAYTGIRQTSPVLINVAKTCGASDFTVFLKVGCPSALTMVFAGIRVALGNSWATLVAAEMLAADSGLGYMIIMGRQFARADIVILGIAVIGVIGTLFVAVLDLVEDKVLGWKKQ